VRIGDVGAHSTPNYASHGRWCLKVDLRSEFCKSLPLQLSVGLNCGPRWDRDACAFDLGLCYESHGLRLQMPAIADVPSSGPVEKEKIM
jgi:hypothetical protein